MDTSKYEIPIPKQKIAFSEKDDKWGKACVDAFINLSVFSGVNYKYDTQKLYDAYNGIVYEADYNYVTQPYGKFVNNSPSKIRNFPILSPTVDTLYGEYIKRPKNYSVVCRNSDTLSSYEQELNAKVNQSVQQMFINELVAKGQVSEEEAAQTEPPQEIAKWFSTNYKDKRAIQGQHALSLLEDLVHIQNKQAQAFKDFLISGEAFTYRDVIGNEVVYECVNPLDIDFGKDPDTIFVEDADWVVRRKISHASSIIDAYYEYLNSEQISSLEKPKNTGVAGFGQYTTPLDNRNGSGLYPVRLVETFHVCWKSRRKFGILDYVDQNGEAQKMEVSEEYKLNKTNGDISLEWFWINEVWEGIRIDKDIYIKIGPHKVQRNHLDNPSICKLPYNGIRFSDRNSRNMSLMAKGLPYQITYNAYKYRLELSVAKAKDAIGVLDINIIPKDWDMDKFMYYMDNMGIAFVDYNQEGFRPNPTHNSILDLTNKSIQAYLLLLDAIEQEWERVSGVTRQRKGQTTQNDLVGTTQQSIIQSGIITEIFYYLFAQLEKADLEALIDYAKVAWIDGKQSLFYNSDMEKNMMMELGGPEFTNSQLGVFVSQSGKDQDKKNQAVGLLGQLAQSGTPTSSLLDIIDSDNFSLIKQKVKVAEDAAHAQEQEIEKMKQEQQAKIQQEQLAHEKFLIDNDNYNKEEDRRVKIEVAEIQVYSRQQELDADGNGIPDPIEIAKLALEERRQTHEEHASEMQDRLDKKAHDLKELEISTNKELTEKEIEAKKFIARQKKTPKS